MVVVTVARKPLPNGGTVASNSLEHGCGPINVDGCRVGMDERTYTPKGIKPGHGQSVAGYDHLVGAAWDGGEQVEKTVQGRWPANLVLGQQAAEALDEQAGHLVSGKPTGTKRGTRGDSFGDLNERLSGVPVTGYGDEGGASRFFKRVK